MMGKLISVPHLAQEWGVSGETLRDLAVAGLLPTVPIAGGRGVTSETRAEWERRLRGRGENA